MLFAFAKQLVKTKDNRTIMNVFTYIKVHKFLKQMTKIQLLEYFMSSLLHGEGSLYMNNNRSNDYPTKHDGNNNKDLSISSFTGMREDFDRRGDFDRGNDFDMRNEFNRRMDFDRGHEFERREEFDRRHDFDLRFPFWWLFFT